MLKVKYQVISMQTRVMSYSNTKSTQQQGLKGNRDNGVYGCEI